jgi:hypothetical protein
MDAVPRGKTKTGKTDLGRGWHVRERRSFIALLSQSAAFCAEIGTKSA